jgi:hypothetical protein
LPVGEQIGAAQRADPGELRECELSVVGLEFDPGAALEALRDLEELIVDDLLLLDRAPARLASSPRRAPRPSPPSPRLRRRAPAPATAFACSTTEAVASAAEPKFGFTDAACASTGST